MKYIFVVGLVGEINGLYKVLEGANMSKRKPDISLAGTPKEREAIVRQIAKTKKLLKHFGIQAFAFDPGVRCFVQGHGNKYIDFDGDTWEFIEPLLKELVQWREYGKKFNMFMSKAERKKYEVVRKRS